MLLLAFLALADAKPRRDRQPEPEPEPPEAPAAPTVPQLGTSLFSGELPFDIGPVPQGLANASAQGCNACHFEAHDGWRDSAHATAWLSDALRAAMDRAGTPACVSCHLPLATQHSELFSLRPGDVNRAVTGPNPSYDATLNTEGVTCAACHIRGGKIVAAGPVDGAPHPMTWTPQLAQSEACAGCHQLTWPGADKPFYDTYGEWQRSPHGAAGIQCQDCHMGPGAGTSQQGSRHGFKVDRARAVSLLISLPSPRLTRGQDGFEATLKLQNTGAGHAFPTGSPFRGVRLKAALVGPDGKDGKPTRQSEFTVDLARKVTPEAPFNTVEDTRIDPGGEQSWSARFGLPINAPPGSWVLEVGLWETVGGDAVGDPFLLRTLPLDVD